MPKYWTGRDSFLRQESKAVRNELMKEIYYNDLFSVFDCSGHFYVLGDFKKRNDSYVFYKTEPEMIRTLIHDRDQWDIFTMRCCGSENELALNERTYDLLFELHENRKNSSDQADFEQEMKSEMIIQQSIFEKEEQIGTPEWRKRIAREVHQNILEQKKRLQQLPRYKKWFLSPSVKRKLKNENDLIYKMQNRIIFEEIEKQEEEKAGVISEYTKRAFFSSLLGIVLFYLLLYLHLFQCQFIPVTLFGLTAVFFLFKDDNGDTKNMNARLVVWVITVINIILASTAVMSMLQS